MINKIIRRLERILIQLRYSIHFNSNPESISLYWYNCGVSNFGDELNPYLISKLTNKKIEKVNCIPILYSNVKILVSIGSIISKASSKTIVWGSGIIDSKHNINNSDFRAVRGPRTQTRLKELGYNVPESIGDPALLLPIIYNKEIDVKYEYGIIPHYTDFHLFKNLNFPDNVLLIDITNDVERFVNDIRSCKRTVSTSLHGIIVSNTYNIESAWISVSDNIYGDNIKYQDYFESVKLFDLKPEYIKPSEFVDVENINQLNYIIPKQEYIKTIQEGLIKSFPFEINM